MKIHEKYIGRCLELAKAGLGTTYPNPLVGSVLVLEDRIIGEGWHYKAGDSHAEVMAIHSANKEDRLSEATLYVNLEPCSHQGRTPPCCDLILAKGIKRVVVGTLDPNPIVAGKGISKLKSQGCEVLVGIGEQDCRELNKRFFTFHQNKRPYIILKWAQSKDGFMDKIRENVPVTKAQPNWITGSLARQRVHQWRTQEQAILVGTETVRKDNPKLTARDWFGNNPLRVVVDKNGSLHGDLYNIFDTSAPTLILTQTETQRLPSHLIADKIDFEKPLAREVCRILYEMEVQSLLVEGGSNTLSQFIEHGIWDEARVFVGNIKFKQGLVAPKLDVKPERQERIGEDCLMIYRRK